MGKHWNDHIGDDQLVGGMPKRMVGVSKQKNVAKSGKQGEFQDIKKDEVSSGKLYPANQGQWQASPGACEKCRAFDGNYYSLGTEPERPHPNCKCKVVECFYGSDYSQWKEYDREVFYEMATPVFAGTSATVVWTKTTVIKVKRNRVTFKICGERKDIIDSTNPEVAEQKQVEKRFAKANCVSQGSVDKCDFWWCVNPWDPNDVQRGRFNPGP